MPAPALRVAAVSVTALTLGAVTTLTGCAPTDGTAGPAARSAVPDVTVAKRPSGGTVVTRTATASELPGLGPEHGPPCPTAPARR
jgi:hypothetical protein